MREIGRQGQGSQFSKFPFQWISLGEYFVGRLSASVLRLAGSRDASLSRQPRVRRLIG
jgi:hypothetical protein